MKEMNRKFYRNMIVMDILGAILGIGFICGVAICMTIVAVALGQMFVAVGEAIFMALVIFGIIVGVSDNVKDELREMHYYDEEE